MREAGGHDEVKISPVSRVLTSPIFQARLSLVGFTCLALNTLDIYITRCVDQSVVINT